MSTVLLSHSASDVVRKALLDLDAVEAYNSYLDWSCFISDEPEKPDNCVTIYDTTPVLDGRLQVSGEVQQHYGIQLRVRAINHPTGFTQITLLVRKLDEVIRQTTVELDDSVYLIHSASKSSGPIPLGKMRDNSLRMLFTANYLVTITEETSGT